MHAERTAPPPPPRGRPRWHTPLLLALLLLAAGNGVGLARQVRALRDALPYLRTAADLPPFAWRAQSAAVAALERLLTAADPHLGPGVRVRVVVPEKIAAETHYVRSWAAYLRPATIWRTPGDDPDERPGDLVLAWQTRLDDPALALLLDTPEGALYRRLQ